MEFSLKDYLRKKEKIINDKLNSIMTRLSNNSLMRETMTYSLMAGGKRLRPILCLAGAEIVKSDYKKAVTTACAIEMIHTYSLIHDDLPAMDNDELRRGMPTLHIKYKKYRGEAIAILAGDGLLTLAFEIMLSDAAKAKNPLPLIKAANLIADAAGYNNIIAGQTEDILSEGKKRTLSKIEKIDSLKTGALINASVLSGAIIGGADLKRQKSLEIYAKNIGFAFQITDDILNVVGDQKTMGKAVGTDKTNLKNTFPDIMGLDKSKKYAENLIKNALKALDKFDDKLAEPLKAVALYVIERNK
ncbi:MAG: polyprenyl synthetase family protein [Deltaproteobacteria bacterium]|nr:polyprenyl synthetase family protein [Deltaproteobacteria bacterium]